MCNPALLIERLGDGLEALQRIPHRFAGDVEEVFDICRNDIPVLIDTVQVMLKDLADETSR